jgi:small subunit ribosomal protein S8
MLNTLVNASRVRKERVSVPYSRFNETLAHFLQRKGYLAKVDERGSDKNLKLLVTLAYTEQGPALQGVRRLSKPGQRWYVHKKDIPFSAGRRGMVIVSTPHGLLDNTEAQKKNTGGELICEVW